MITKLEILNRNIKRSRGLRNNKGSPLRRIPGRLEHLIRQYDLHFNNRYDLLTHLQACRRERFLTPTEKELIDILEDD